MPFPLTITEEYRDAAARWDPYIPGYYAFLALMVGFALLLDPAVLLLRRLLPRRDRIVALAAAAILGAGSFTAVAATAIANAVVSDRQAGLSAKWRVVDAVLRTDALDRLPANSVVLAPALWDDFPKGSVWYEDYWSQYIELHSRRRVRVVRTLNEVSFSVDRLPPLYYAALLRGGCSGDGLLITSIARHEHGNRLLSDKAILASKHAPDACDLEAIAAGKSADLLLPEDPRTYIQVPQAGVQHGMFVDEIYTPAVIAGSVIVTPHRDQRWLGLPSVELEFAKGFSSREEGGGQFWIWSDGASGEAEVNFKNNTANALTVRFHSLIVTGQPEKARFDIDTPERRQSLLVGNGQTSDWVLHLQPGDNQIRMKSFGRRVEAPGDPRYMVFGLHDWSLTECDQECVKHYSAN